MGLAVCQPIVVASANAPRRRLGSRGRMELISHGGENASLVGPGVKRATATPSQVAVRQAALARQAHWLKAKASMSRSLDTRNSRKLTDLYLQVSYTLSSAK